MKLDVEKAKELLKIFGCLDEENQNALIAKALIMEAEQSFRTTLIYEGKPLTEENFEGLRGGVLNVLNPLMENWDRMGANHRAALAIMLNDMSEGEFTKEEYIDFVVRSRQLSISEYIEKYIPGADFEEAKRIYKSINLDRKN